MTDKLRSDLLLLLAAAIWGLAFVAQRLGMEHLGPLTFNAVRFVMGAAALAPVVWWRGRGGRAQPWPVDLRRGLVLGLVLCGGATLQQWGVVSTTAGKAGFITGLYVVLVPFLGLFIGQRTHGRTWAGAVLAVVGLYFLTITGRLAMSRGDTLVLVGAVFWATHVLLIGRWAPHTEPVRLAALQFLVCGVISAAAGLPLERPNVGAIAAAAGPLLYAGLASTGIAYTLQVVAQRHAPPAHAAIILSLEAVFAVLGGMLVLGEALPTRGLLGCVLMLAGMILSQLEPRRRRRAAA
ncbi:MAG: DMT family transporter [Candidatus Krumholzibacteriia bacterium]